MQKRTSIQRLRDFLTRLPFVHQLGIRLTVGIFVSVVCLIVFSAVADGVLEKGDLTIFDQPLSDALHFSATPSSISAYRFISFWGMEGAALIGIAVGVYLLSRRQWLTLMVWGAALIGGFVMNNVLKLIFARPRPMFLDPFIIVPGYSFPSGHSMQSLIVYGMLGALLWSRLHNHYVRIFLSFALALLIILVGISRIMLGVHFFSDVIGGFAAGGVWLAICITALAALNRRKQRAPAASERELAKTKA